MNKHLHPFLPACSLVESPSFEETPIGRLVAFAGALCLIEGLVPRTCLVTRALAHLLVEDIVVWTGRRLWDVANTLAGVTIKVSVRAAVVSLIPVPTHTLTAFHIQFFIWAAHVRCKYVCTHGGKLRERQRDS